MLLYWISFGAHFVQQSEARNNTVPVVASTAKYPVGSASLECRAWLRPLVTTWKRDCVHWIHDVTGDMWFVIDCGTSCTNCVKLVRLAMAAIQYFALSFCKRKLFPYHTKILSYFVCMVLLTVRTHGPYYTNSGYLPCALCARPV